MEPSEATDEIRDDFFGLSTKKLEQLVVDRMRKKQRRLKTLSPPSEVVAAAAAATAPGVEGFQLTCMQIRVVVVSELRAVDLHDALRPMRSGSSPWLSHAPHLVVVVVVVVPMMEEGFGRLDGCCCHPPLEDPSEGRSKPEVRR